MMNFLMAISSNPNKMRTTYKQVFKKLKIWKTHQQENPHPGSLVFKQNGSHALWDLYPTKNIPR